MKKQDKKPILVGIKFKCIKGHVWESEVYNVWKVYPMCPKCETQRTPTAWRGIWK